MHKLFGGYVQKTRKKEGLTAQNLAKACGVSRSYITLIENGKRLPGKKVLPLLAAALNIKTAVILNWYLEDISQKMKEDLKI